MSYETQPISLLWPPGSLEVPTRQARKISPAAWRDLGLSHLIHAFSPDQQHQKEIAQVFEVILQDPEAIEYRQEIFDDLLQHPQLVERFEALMPAIDALGRITPRVVKDQSSLHEITWRLGELQSIVDCIQGLTEIFRAPGVQLRSQGLRVLQQEIETVQQNPSFQSLTAELPKLLAELRGCASVTIGVNLDPYLRPVQATLLGVHEEKFTSQSMLNRLFGKRNNPMEGIAQLHSVPQRAVEGPYALPVSSDLGWAVEPIMVPLFQDLALVIEKTSQPVLKQLKRFTDINSRLFTHLRRDLIFYLGGLRFLSALRRMGYPYIAL